MTETDKPKNTEAKDEAGYYPHRLVLFPSDHYSLTKNSQPSRNAGDSHAQQARSGV